MKMKINRKKKRQIQPDVVEEESPLLLITPSFDTGFTASLEQNVQTARNTLYISHLSAKFTELAWQFCLILFLSALTGYQSLFLVSTYGLFSGLVVSYFGPSIGRIIDSKKHTRLQIIQPFIWVQNLSVVIGTIGCFFLLRMVKETHVNDLKESIHVSDSLETVSTNQIGNFVPPFNFISISLLIFIHVFGALASLTDQGITIALEIDWIVVMSKYAASEIDDDDELYDMDQSVDTGGSSGLYSVGVVSLNKSDGINTGVIRKLKEKAFLSETNTVMKQIDLSCRVAGPAAAGIFLSFFGSNSPGNNPATDIQHWYNLSYAALICGLINLGSLYVEYVCSIMIFNLIPTLSSRGDDDDDGNVKMKSEENIDETQLKKDSMFVLPRSISIYLEQSVAKGGIALALLYLNVLTFGGLMTAYLAYLGVGYGTIGTLRGISSVIGLLGTVAFHISERSIGLNYTGLWSIVVQFSFLGLCYISLYIHNLTLSLWFLVIGVCCSRIGLYGFDLTITQMMQLNIPEDKRGLIGGVQKALNSFFDLMTYVLGLIFSDPKEFHVLVASGYTSVGIAMILYYFGMYRPTIAKEREGS